MNSYLSGRTVESRFTKCKKYCWGKRGGRKGQRLPDASAPRMASLGLREGKTVLFPLALAE